MCVIKGLGSYIGDWSIVYGAMMCRCYVVSQYCQTARCLVGIFFLLGSGGNERVRNTEERPGELQVSYCGRNEALGNDRRLVDNAQSSQGCRYRNSDTAVKSCSHKRQAFTEDKYNKYRLI